VECEITIYATEPWFWKFSVFLVSLCRGAEIICSSLQYPAICWAQPRNALTWVTSVRIPNVFDGAQINILRSHPVLRDGVNVEGYFLHAELDLCGFDLNACFGTAA
jgi:hypothetical protein